MNLELLTAAQTQADYFTGRVRNRLRRFKINEELTPEVDINAGSDQIDISVRFSMGLRMGSDAGFGRGYHKGQVEKETFLTRKTRKKKNVVNRPMFAFAHNLEEIASANIEDTAQFAIENLRWQRKD